MAKHKVPVWLVMAVGLGLVEVSSISIASVGVKVLPVFMQFSRSQGHNFIILGLRLEGAQPKTVSVPL